MNEVTESMDETPQGSTAESSGRPAPETGAQTVRAVHTHDQPASQPAARRIDAGNTALLIGIIVGLIGSVSVLIGVPVFLLNEEVNRVSDKVEALSDKMDTRFATQDAKIERRFETQDAKIERRFEAQDAKIERRFEAQDASFEARFNSLDAEVEELRRGQSEIDRKLAVLIASLSRTDRTEGAAEGGVVR